MFPRSIIDWPQKRGDTQWHFHLQLDRFPTYLWDRLGFEQSTFLSFNLDSFLCFYSFIFFDGIWEAWGLKFIAVKLHKDWVFVTIHTWFSLKPVLHHNYWWLLFSFWCLLRVSHFVGRCLLQPYNFTEQHLRQVNDECVLWVWTCCIWSQKWIWVW